MSYHEKYTNEKLAESIKDMQDEIARLKELNNLQIGKIQPVEMCNGVGNFNFYPTSYNAGYYTPNYKEIYRKAIEDLETRIKTSREIHIKNKPNIESNKKLIEYIHKIMAQIGIPDSYFTYEYKNARSREKTKVHNRAGYTADFKHIPILDNIENEEKRYKEILAQIEKYKADEEAKETAKIREQEQQQAKLKENRLLMKMIVKYNLPDDSTRYSVINHILSLDKYLLLGHYLYKNRSEFGDGCSYAENGLNNFKVENETDSLIYNCIQKLIDNWDGDGRVFRDCEWNYDKLFSMANNEVYNDYFQLEQLTETDTNE